jgi:MEDS: MEthanogen/methylotroph, DcmR Sensory domain
VLHAAADPFPDRHVRLIGEPIWPSRTALEYPKCVQHEAFINLAFQGRPVTILCPYDAAQIDPDVLHDAERTHPVLSENGKRRVSTTYDPARAIARTNRPLPPPSTGAAAQVRRGTAQRAASGRTLRRAPGGPARRTGG